MARLPGFHGCSTTLHVTLRVRLSVQKDTLKLWRSMDRLHSHREAGQSPDSMSISEAGRLGHIVPPRCPQGPVPRVITAILYSGSVWVLQPQWPLSGLGGSPAPSLCCCLKPQIQGESGWTKAIPPIGSKTVSTASEGLPGEPSKKLNLPPWLWLSSCPVTSRDMVEVGPVDTGTIKTC